MSSNTAEQNGPSSGSSPTSERSVSLGKYRVIAKLGTGGMAEVYLAVAQGAMNVNRLVVVKRLREEQAADPESREMFLNEARLAARLNHPNVIQTFEAGVEGSSYYLAMEYVEGQPLSRVLSRLMKEKRRLEPKIAARIVADALCGLHYAHELTDFDGTALEIVHRDVSPQNMMLTYSGVTKIVDFGIAKAAGSTQTAHGVFKGKVAFMAPEQVIGEKVDGRADVFAAGIVLWEALTGRHLMAADTPAKTLHNLLNRPIPRASEVCPDVPLALDQIAACALERDLGLRYPTAKAMRDALEQYIGAYGGVTNEEVGAVVMSLFADRRKSVQDQVKAQLAALSFTSRPTESGLHLAHGKAQARPSTAAVIDLSEAGPITDSQPSRFRFITTGGGVVPATQISESAPARSSRVARALLVAVTVTALGVSGLALYRSQRAPVVSEPPAPVVVVAPPVASPSAIVTATASVVASAPAATTHAPSASAPPPHPAPTPEPPRAAVANRHAPPPQPATAAAPVTPPAPATDTPRPPPAAPSTPHSSTPHPPPAETTQGRTFRRDL